MVNIHAITSEQLEYFKRIYERTIDSRRIFDRIQSLNDLIHVLKKRDCDLHLLYDELRSINQTETYPERLPSPNISLESRTHPILPNIPNNPIERIDQLIANEIGQKWKDLARALKVPEGKIDELSSFRLSETIREILRYHRSSEYMWKTELTTALCTARRKDLSIEVQKIFELYQMN